MQVKDGIILNVQGRNTKTQKVVYDISFSDGQDYSTFDDDLARVAQAAKNQNVSIGFEITQNGKYTNYNLKAVGPVGSLVGDAGGAGAIPIAGQGAATDIPMKSSGGGGGGGGGMSPEDKTRLTKLSVISSAAALVGSVFASAGPEALKEAEEHVARIAHGWYDSARNHETKPVAAEPEQAALDTPSAIQAAVQAALAAAGVGGGVQVGTAGLQTAEPVEQPDAAAAEPTAGADIPWGVS